MCKSTWWDTINDSLKSQFHNRIKSEEVTEKIIKALEDAGFRIIEKNGTPQECPSDCHYLPDKEECPKDCDKSEPLSECDGATDPVLCPKCRRLGEFNENIDAHGTWNPFWWCELCGIKYDKTGHFEYSKEMGDNDE